MTNFPNEGPIWERELIGRAEVLEDILAEIRGLLVGGGRHLITVQAPGGMGKTRLVSALRDECVSALQCETVLLDLASPDYRLLLKAEHEIATSAGTGVELDRFVDVVSAYESLNHQNMAGVASMSSVIRSAAQAFADCFTAPFVLILDTIDLPISTSMSLRNLIGSSVAKLRDVVVILAGRDAHAVTIEYQSVYNTSTVSLGPLEPRHAVRFFDGLSVERILLDSIVDHSGGRPVLLCLAAEWLASRDPVPDNWYGGQRSHHEFERALVERYVGLRGESDLTILQMARTPFRYTVSMAAYLEGNSRRSNTDRPIELPSGFLIKRLGSDIVVLHDEIRDLVNEYVWPSIDPLGSERADLDAKLVGWYAQIIEAHRNTLTDPAADRLMDVLCAEQYFYLLRGSAASGVSPLLREVSLAIGSGRYEYAGLMLEISRPVLSAAPQNEIGQLQVFEAEWLRAVGRRSAAYQVLSTLLENHTLSPSQRIATQILTASVLRENGQALEANRLLGSIDREMLEAYSLIPEFSLEIAEVLMATGYYTEAVFELNTLINMDTIGSWWHTEALTKSAFANSVLGRRDIALQQIDRVLKPSSGEAPPPTFVASSLATLASIHRDSSNFDDAVAAYNAALQKYMDLGDPYRVAVVFTERGLCHLLRYEENYYSEARSKRDPFEALSAAGSDLAEAVRLCSVYNWEYLPKAQHELGHVRWESGRPDQAKVMWEKSLASSIKSGNLRYVLENLVGSAELAVEAGAWDESLAVRRTMMPYYDKTKDSHQLLWSRLRKLEAEAQFNLGLEAMALEGFAVAIPELAAHGGWGRYRLEFELSRLKRLIRSLPIDQKLHWADILRSSWRSGMAQLRPTEQGQLEAFIGELGAA